MHRAIRRISMIPLRTDAECSSLSPDQTRIAYEKRLETQTGGMWLAVSDPRTGQESLLAKIRSVDDQAEWFASNRLLHGLRRLRFEATASDVWVVPADGTRAPTVSIPQASSPAVVR
jgi:hypothetical protein